MWDDETRTPFALLSNKAISYDDEQSIGEKVRFAMVKGLAGAMVWSLDTDDFHGDCGRENFPLVRQIDRAIERSLEEIERDKENAIDHGDHSNRKEGGEGRAAALQTSLACLVLATVAHLH